MPDLVLPGGGFEVCVTAQFDELDPQGVLHNSRYAVHVERAVSALLTAAGWSWDDDDETHPDRWHVVRRFVIEHHAAVRGTAQMRVVLTSADVGRTSTTHYFVIRAHGQLVADGARSIVRVDPRTGQPAPWTDRWRSWHGTTLGSRVPDKIYP